MQWWLKQSGRLFDGDGPVTHVFTYRAPNAESDELVFEGYDTSAATVAAVRDHLSNDPIGKMTLALFQRPNSDVFSLKPTDRHVQRRVEYGYRRAEVDEGIAPLILALWERGWDTMGSCENSPEHGGKAYLDFPNGAHGREFCEAMTAAGIEARSIDSELVLSTSAGDCVFVVAKLLIQIPPDAILAAVSALRTITSLNMNVAGPVE